MKIGNIGLQASTCYNQCQGWITHALDRPWSGSAYGLVSLLDMLRFYADRFHRAVNMIAAFRAIVTDLPPGRPFTPTLRQKWLNQLEPLSILLGEMNLLVSKKNVDYLIDSVKANKGVDREFRHLLGCNFRVMNDELSLAMLFSVRPENSKYYDPPEPLFGTDFESKFASAGAFEIDEAGKCLALGRSTAAVFHLMRVMEIGIRTVATALGVPDPVKGSDRNWYEMLKKIKAAIDNKNSGRSWAIPTDKALFESAYASLDAIRVAWRNATMHIDSKYLPEEAEHIFVAVRGFMKQIGIVRFRA